VRPFGRRALRLISPKKKDSVARLPQRNCAGPLAAFCTPTRRGFSNAVVPHPCPSLAARAPHRWLLCGLRHHQVPHLHPRPSRKGRQRKHVPTPPSTSHVSRKGRHVLECTLDRWHPLTSACCKSMFQVFQRYVASVIYQCCKIRSRYFTCCNGYTCMFHMFHQFQTYVAIVLSGCCKSKSGRCIYMHVTGIYSQVFSGVSYVCLQVFQLDATYIFNGFQMFSGGFASIAYVCFKCFICLFYVTAVASRCFKSRSDVAHKMRVGNG
jgi:hypothetical protein